MHHAAEVSVDDTADLARAALRCFSELPVEGEREVRAECSSVANAGRIQHQPIRKKVQTGKLVHSAQPLDRLRFSSQTDYAT